jgi:hypothetical protein
MNLKLIGLLFCVSAIPALGSPCDTLKTRLNSIVTEGFLSKHMRCSAASAKTAGATALVINATTVDLLEKIKAKNTADCKSPTGLKAYDGPILKPVFRVGISGGKINHLDAHAPTTACKII